MQIKEIFIIILVLSLSIAYILGWVLYYLSQQNLNNLITKKEGKKNITVMKILSCLCILLLTISVCVFCMLIF